MTSKQCSAILLVVQYALSYIIPSQINTSRTSNKCSTEKLRRVLFWVYTSCDYTVKVNNTQTP